jgi:hypothetical protein
VALVAVMLSMAILSLFLLSSLAYALNSTVPARKDQDAKTAEGAAEAGIDEYISRLNANDNYWKGGNVDSTNAAFTSAGQVIQGTGTSGAKYKYTLLTTASQTAANGVIRLQVTGMSSPNNGTAVVSRTLTATLQPKGFLSYVYLTDFEVIDPDLLGDPAACANYYYAVPQVSPARTAGDCTEIQWQTGDKVQGPLHSNDALQVNGLVNFTNVKTETSWPSTNGAAATAKTWWGTQPYPLAGKPPKYAPPIPLPASNNTLLQNVTPDVDGDSSTPVGPGCYYTGVTRIIMQGTTMKVLSPSTTRSDTSQSNPQCYNPGTPTTEQTVPIPPVIYVDSSSSGCTVGAVGYPSSNEEYTAGTTSAISWGVNPNFDCHRGSVYIQGASNTQVTIAAKDDVVITGDITLTGGAVGTNVVGLIAGNFAWVYHPLKNNTTTNLYSSPNVNNVTAAILALRHSFVVQNWSSGASLGTLNVTGSISQKFRGAVGASGGGCNTSCGYLKNYVYDTRLSYLQPPFFLKATNSPWELATVTDK